jgi:hypothetical protein
MKYEYSCLFSFDLGKLSSEVGDFMTSLNSHLSSMGVNERLSARSGEFQLFVCTLDRELTQSEIMKMKTTMTEAVNAVGSPLAQYGLVCSEVRRKSGNVSQSVIQ